MLPALSPRDAYVVNNRSLSVKFEPIDTLRVSMIVNPHGEIIFHHVMYLAANNTWQSAN